MKTTGIIRRVDDLGRIVLPRVVRRHIGISEGTAMEIFISKDEITLKKYYPENDLFSKTENLMESVEEMCIHLGTKETGDIRGHIREIQKLLKQEKSDIHENMLLTKPQICSNSKKCNVGCMNPQIKPGDYGDIYIFVPNMMQIVRISEGCSVNLSSEDVEQGYVDYIYYQQYDIECELAEDDGGEILLKEAFDEKYGCTADAIPAVLDMAYGDISLKYMILSR